MKDIKKNIFAFIVCVILGVCITLAYKYLFPRNSYEVVGESMFPTYQEGAFVKVTPYKNNSTIDRYTVIVANYKFPSSKIIKRVVGLPGESIYIDDNGVIYANEMELTEELIYTNGAISSAGIAKEPIALDEDEYFVIGDNTANSIDSRSFGPIKRKNIVAVVQS